jgi:hypothetical protein
MVLEGKISWVILFTLGPMAWGTVVTPEVKLATKEVTFPKKELKLAKLFFKNLLGRKILSIEFYFLMKQCLYKVPKTTFYF